MRLSQIEINSIIAMAIPTSIKDIDIPDMFKKFS